MIVKNFIAGKWTTSKTSNFFDVINPATEETIAQTPMGTSLDVDNAVCAAKDAFLSWRKTPATERIQYLFKLKHLMEEQIDEISRIITTEHGKTLTESKGSVRRAIQMLETASSIPTLMMGEAFENIASDIDSYCIKKPLGVFAAISPFNFPAMVPFWFWPFAIACGNTFVLKASERVPLTSVKIFELLEKIELPTGVMNLVHGGKEVVDEICCHKDIKGISFVGSTPVAKHVYKMASSHLKRVQALGGAKNFMVAMPDATVGALKQKSINTAIESITGCAGERCLAGSVILCVGDQTYETFKKEVVESVKKIKIGNGLHSNIHMGPLISKESKERVCNLISNAQKDGAEVLYDGRNYEKKSKGYFLAPTVLANIKKDMEIAQVEIFGPVVLLAKTPSLNSAIEWINSLDLANTATLFTSSGAHARQFSSEIDPSMIGINIGVPAPMSFFSFGGSKSSFFGDIKVHGRQCIPFFTDSCTTIYRWHNENSIW